MATRLNDVDRRAVDTLLDGTCSGAPASSTSELQFQQRLASARRWLDLMGAMPVEEPPAGLVAATMARIDASPRINPASTDASTGARL